MANIGRTITRQVSSLPHIYLSRALVPQVPHECSIGSILLADADVAGNGIVDRRATH